MKSTQFGLGLALVAAGALLHCGSDGGSTPSTIVDASVPDVVVPNDDAGSDSGSDAGDGSRVIPNVLSGWGLFTGGPDTKGHLTPVKGTIPYELTTALFSDYALKARTITIPPGKSAGFDPEKVLDFPVGTVISKTFSFPADLRAPEVAVKLVETRILIHQPAGWEAYPYFWNDEQTEATLVPGGRVVAMSLVDLEGGTRTFSYLVPSRNQCQQCHHLLDENGAQVMHPIGPKARYLNRNNVIEGQDQNQLSYFASHGQLTGLPSDAPRAPVALDPTSGTLDERARTYLDINCAHCHNPDGTAGRTSQLFLNHTSTSEFNLGVCKRPGSAGGNQGGGEFDVQPGDHALSILWNRVHTTESGKMMPQIGRAILHDEGAQLLADWIDGMTVKTCQ